MFSISMRKYFKVFIFTFTYFNVYNSINASTIDEENVEVDEESKTSVEHMNIMDMVVITVLI